MPFLYILAAAVVGGVSGFCLMDRMTKGPDPSGYATIFDLPFLACGAMGGALFASLVAAAIF